MNADEWRGRVGAVWAEEWPRTDRTFAAVDAALVEACVATFADAAAAHILDIGCGAGATSLALADRLPKARITGIDLSPALIEAAQTRDAAGRCRFEVADATTWTRARDHDLLVSRHGVMFFDDPAAAFAHLRTLAKPGAPLIFSCFRAPALNPWAGIVTGLLPNQPPTDSHAPGPFAFADEARVAAILAEAGWRDPTATPLDYAYIAGEGAEPVADAVVLFGRVGPSAVALREAQGPDRAALLDGIARVCQDHLGDGRVSFPAAAWIWSATA